MSSSDELGNGSQTDRARTSSVAEDRGAPGQRPDAGDVLAALEVLRRFWLAVGPEPDTSLVDERLDSREQWRRHRVLLEALDGQIRRAELLELMWVGPRTIAQLWDVSPSTVADWATSNDPRLPEPVVQRHRLTRYLLRDVIRCRDRWLAAE